MDALMMEGWREEGRQMHVWPRYKHKFEKERTKVIHPERVKDAFQAQPG